MFGIYHIIFGVNIAVCDFSTCVIEQALRDTCLWKLSNKIPIKLTSILFIYDVVPNTSISRWFFVKWNVKYLQEGRFMVDDCLTERIGGLRYLKTKCIDWRNGLMVKNTSCYSGGSSSLPRTHVSCLQLQVLASHDLFWPSGRLYTWSEH